MQNLNILELRCIAQAQLTFPIRIDKQSCTQLPLRLLYLIQALDDDSRQFLKIHVQLLFFLQ